SGGGCTRGTWPRSRTWSASAWAASAFAPASASTLASWPRRSLTLRYVCRNTSPRSTTAAAVIAAAVQARNFGCLVLVTGSHQHFYRGVGPVRPPARRFGRRRRRRVPGGQREVR